jgi:hypothetical protein
VRVVGQPKASSSFSDFLSSARQTWRVARLRVILFFLALAAIVTNVDRRPIEILATAVGLSFLGPPVVELLMRLTEGLVVLFVLSFYVESRPFKQVEDRIVAVRDEHVAFLSREFRQLESSLSMFHRDQLTFLAAQVQLTALLQARSVVSVGNLTDLILPRVAPVLAATIRIDLWSPAGDPPVDNKLYYLDYSGSFEIRQPEYVIGVVNAKAHLDRLRDANAPIHDIFVLSSATSLEDRSVDEIVSQYGIQCRYRRTDVSATVYDRAPIEKIVNMGDIWTPGDPQDEFPLLLLRATFPHVAADQTFVVELRYQLLLSKREGFCFWAASRPIYVETISLDASRLTGTHSHRFERFLPNFDRGGTSDVADNNVYRVKVENWVLKGHGVMLMWQSDPPDARQAGTEQL